MSNLEKHKRNLMEEWAEGEEGSVPAQSGVHASEPGRMKKSVPRKTRLPLATAPAARPDPALVREPSQKPHAEVRHSQASSPEHLRKLDRLPKLRAPYAPRAAKPGSGPRP